MYFVCGLMAERKQYSLRSGSGEVIHVPINIQSVSDTEFLGMLASKHTSTQENSDSSSNEEQDEVVVGQSGAEQTVSSENTVKNVPGSSGAAGCSVPEGSTQQAINLQILNQLENIGKQLNAIEKKGKNKTNDVSKIKGKSKSSAIDAPVTLSSQQSLVSDIPNLHALRSDAMIQAQVEQRLRDLVDENKSGTKIKSLRGGSVDVIVPHRVKWPQEYVLSGIKKERVQYDNLSVTQWVAGFCRIMKEESNVEKNSIRDAHTPQPREIFSTS